MFVDNALTGVAGEDIKVCVLLEDATGDIKRTLNVSVSTINETAFSTFTMPFLLSANFMDFLYKP